MEKAIKLTCDPDNPTSDCSILSTVLNGWDSITVKYKHPILRFFTIYEARELRILCKEFLHAVECTPWNDTSSYIGREDTPGDKTLEYWRTSFPRAISGLAEYYPTIPADARTFLSEGSALIVVGFKEHTSNIFWETERTGRNPPRYILFEKYCDVDTVCIYYHPPSNVSYESTILHLINTLGKLKIKLNSDSVEYWFNVMIMHTSSQSISWLHRCIEFPAIIRCLLKIGADINITNYDDGMPLHLACRNENYEVVKLLLEHGADCHALKYDGSCTADTPLHIACETGNRMIVMLLLKYGTNINASIRNHHRRAYGDYTCTPLDYAIYYKHEMLATELVALGAVKSTEVEITSGDSYDAAGARRILPT